MFSDYTFSPTLRYEAHRIISSPAGEEPVEFCGVLAAAIYSALIVDTTEGKRRGMALETKQQREQWVQAYELETRREDGGLFSTEIQWLNDAYIALDFSSGKLMQICGVKRLFSLAVELTVDYMQRIALEEVGRTIYEALPFYQPFAQWLYEAAFAETRRQTILQTDWTDAAKVFYLSTLYANDQPPITNDQSPITNDQPPTFVFEGLSADQLMATYYDWLWAGAQAEAALQPNSKSALARYRTMIMNQETEAKIDDEDLSKLSPEDQRTFRHWLSAWTEYLSNRLHVSKEVAFWVQGVPEQVQEHLLYHLRLQEQKKAHFRCLTTAIYALRQLGYIRRKCSDKAIRQWLSERLSIDYTTKSNASQFQRAMKEHGRYTPEVQDEVTFLNTMGYSRYVPFAPEPE